jgi:small subunit ribosomal protein S19e
MTTVYDVPPDVLISVVARDLRKSKKVRPPEWASFVKTGTHREKAPVERDWWYTRMAAILRKVYVRGPVGTERLAAEFGGRRDRGSAPYHPTKGGRSIVRECLNQLEALGYVQKVDKKGRVITPRGQSYLDNKAHEILARLSKERPELAKYA